MNKLQHSARHFYATAFKIAIPQPELPKRAFCEIVKLKFSSISNIASAALGYHRALMLLLLLLLPQCSARNELRISPKDISAATRIYVEGKGEIQLNEINGADSKVLSEWRGVINVNSGNPSNVENELIVVIEQLISERGYQSKFSNQIVGDRQIKEVKIDTGDQIFRIHISKGTPFVVNGDWEYGLWIVATSGSYR